jgi:MoxR-like ATPase
LFHYVTFPDDGRLIQIMQALFPTVGEGLVQRAVERFLALRQEMQQDKGVGKKVSTSELIDWFRVLKRYPEEGCD